MSFATNDSATRHSAGVAITAEEIAAGEQKASDDVARYALAPVSYTHLTLPTICSV